MLPRTLRVLLVLVLVTSARASLAACLPDPPADGDDVVCDGVDSTGYDGSGATGLTITTDGVTVLDESDPGLDAAILVGDDNRVTIGADATVNVTEVGGVGIDAGDSNAIGIVGAIDVMAADGFGVRAGNDNLVENAGSIDLMQNGGVGISVGDDNTVRNFGAITVTGDDGVGVRVGDSNLVESRGTISVDGDDGVGILGGDDNFIRHELTIDVDGDDGRAISIGRNTTGILPNGILTTSSSLIRLRGLRGIGLEAGDDSGISNQGQMNIEGADSRGIFAGNRTDLGIAANVSNATSSVLAIADLRVDGDGAIGIATGDGWFAGTDQGGTPTATGFGIFNTGRITVAGAGATGIFAGDPGNTNFDNNSFVLNQFEVGQLAPNLRPDIIARTGLIDVTGAGAVGVSLGGNDLLTAADLSDGSIPDVYTFQNFGAIRGDDDAGPLIEFRGFVAGQENRLFNGPVIERPPGPPPMMEDRNLGEIEIDLTNPDPVAIRGSDGMELIVNLGRIQGNVELNDGDDRFVQAQDAEFDGMLLGGGGFDELLLYPESSPDPTSLTPVFDVSNLDAFEQITIRGRWGLSNVAGFGGDTAIEAGGRLEIDAPLAFQGDFSVDPAGTLDVVLDAAPPPLTVDGFTELGGTLVIRRGDTLTPSPTPYRVVLANGGLNGTFAEVETFFSIDRFTPIYDAMGLLVLFEQSPLFPARTANQRAIAQHLIDIDAAGGASADLQAFIDDLSDSTGNLSVTYNTLSPEVYDVHTQVVVEGGRRIANLLLDRPRECQPGVPDHWNRIDKELPCHARTWAPWVAVVGGFRSREKHDGHLRYDSQMGGLVAGVDVHPLEGLDLTFAIGSQRGKLDAAGAGESTVTLTDVSGHAAYSLGPFRGQLVASWGHGFHRDRRLIQESESAYALDSRGKEEHDSDRITAAAEIGVLFDVFQFQVEPLVGVDWAWVYQRPIHESGAGGFGVRIASRDDGVGSVNAGVRLSTIYRHRRYLIRQLEWMDGIWQPSVEVRWRQMLQGDDRTIDARFQGTPDAVGDFRIEGDEDDGGAEIGVGVRFTPTHANRLQFDLRYDAFVGPHTLEQDLFGRVTLGF